MKWNQFGCWGSAWEGAFCSIFCLFVSNSIHWNLSLHNSEVNVKRLKTPWEIFKSFRQLAQCNHKTHTLILISSAFSHMWKLFKMSEGCWNISKSVFSTPPFCLVFRPSSQISWLIKFKAQSWKLPKNCNKCNTFSISVKLAKFTCQGNQNAEYQIDQRGGKYQKPRWMPSAYRNRDDNDRDRATATVVLNIYRKLWPTKI